MRSPLLAILVPLALVGCLAPAADDAAPADEAAPAAAAAAEPTVVVWSGFVLASEVDGPSHMRPTEDALWPVQQEGFLLDITEEPRAMEVALEWEGEGEMMIMLHSHKEHGTNAYVEHITALDAENPKCLRVPTEDLTAGVWQVMVHSEGARQLPFTLRVGLVGGAASVVEDDLHGHWLQDGSFEVDEHEIEPCAFLLPAAPAS